MKEGKISSTMVRISKKRPKMKRIISMIDLQEELKLKKMMMISVI